MSIVDELRFNISIWLIFVKWFVMYAVAEELTDYFLINFLEVGYCCCSISSWSSFFNFFTLSKCLKTVIRDKMSNPASILFNLDFDLLWTRFQKILLNFWNHHRTVLSSIESCSKANAIFRYAWVALLGLNLFASQKNSWTNTTKEI